MKAMLASERTARAKAVRVRKNGRRLIVSETAEFGGMEEKSAGHTFHRADETLLKANPHTTG